MKHKFIRIIVVSIIIALNISCEKQQEFSEQPKHKGLTIKATADASSRTTFDGESSKWSIDDELNIYISGGGYFGTSNQNIHNNQYRTRNIYQR